MSRHLFDLHSSRRSSSSSSSSSFFFFFFSLLLLFDETSVITKKKKRDIFYMRARVKVPIHLTHTHCFLLQIERNCFLLLLLNSLLMHPPQTQKIEIEIFDMMMMMIVNGVVLCVYVCCASFFFQKNPGRSQQSSHCLVVCDVIKSSPPPPLLCHAPLDSELLDASENPATTLVLIYYQGFLFTFF